MSNYADELESAKMESIKQMELVFGKAKEELQDAGGRFRRLEVACEKACFLLNKANLEDLCEFELGHGILYEVYSHFLSKDELEKLVLQASKIVVSKTKQLRINMGKCNDIDLALMLNELSNLTHRCADTRGVARTICNINVGCNEVDDFDGKIITDLKELIEMLGKWQEELKKCFE